MRELTSQVSDLVEEASSLKEKLAFLEKENAALKHRQQNWEDESKGLRAAAKQLREENANLLYEREHYMRELRIEHDQLQTLFREARAARLSLANDASEIGVPDAFHESSPALSPRRCTSSSLAPPPPPPNPPPLSREGSLMQVYSPGRVKSAPVNPALDDERLQHAIRAALAQSLRLASPGP